jgi:hypothetical protein
MCFYRRIEDQELAVQTRNMLEENRLSNEAIHYQWHLKSYKINKDNVNGYMQLAFGLGYKENKYVSSKITEKAKDIYDSLVSAQNNGYSAEELVNEALVGQYEYLQIIG